MDNMLEKIYRIVFITAFAVNGLALLLFNINPDWVTIWTTLLIFVISTIILFLMGRLVQERFDNTLQMYLIIYSACMLISTFIPEYRWDVTPFEALASIAIFALSYFVDDIFEAGQ